MNNKKHDGLFRLIYLVITILVILAGLVMVYIHDPIRFWWIIAIGICLGIILLFLVLGTVQPLVSERKQKLYQAQELKRFNQHQDRFYCHICGKPSPQPYQYWDDYGENGQQYSSFLVTDYNKPTELVQCVQCQKWTCANADPPHLENGVCKKCLELSPEQV